MKKTTALIITALAAAPLAHAAEGGFVGGLLYAAKDPVTFVAFLSLVAFLLIAAKMGAFKAMIGGLDSRAEGIRKQIEEAASLREQAAEALALAERRAQDADKEAEAIIDQAKRDAKELLEAARRDLADKIARREAQATARIDRAETEAASEVRRAAADAATVAARKLLAEQTSVDQFEAAAREIERALS